MEHFYEALKSVKQMQPWQLPLFHYKEVDILDLKRYLN